MKIREIRLREFKRFTRTTITDIPITARLVMLAGPNGSGKSSLIDAAFSWHRNHWKKNAGHVWDDSYHRKQVEGSTSVWNNAVEVDFYDPQPATVDERKRAVYARSAYRNEPEFSLSNLEALPAALDESRLNRLIENDQTVRSNYQRLVSEGFRDVFEHADTNLTLGQFREQSIGEIRTAMSSLFPGLVLNSLGNPLNKGTFRFDKGESAGFEYMNLSGGEKAVFDLLLDLLIKRREFVDTVFFIDEPEAHVSPGLQGRLLDSLMEVVPDGSQLWLATHSIGMMRRARDIEKAHPGGVAFLDFDGINFDVPQTLRPVLPDRPFWIRAMQIALDDLAGYVTPEQVILCEGGRLSGGRDFDAECYNTIFAEGFPHAVFFGAGNVDDIRNDPRGVGNLLKALAPRVRITKVVDRDDRTDDECEALGGVGIRVLLRRTLESYLLDDSVLRLMCEEFERPEVAETLLALKQKALVNSIAAGGPADDFKRVSGDIYLEAKRLFPERKLGSDKKAFLKAICAPLVSKLPIYEELRDCIF